MSVLPDTDSIAHEIVALCSSHGLRAIPFEPSGAWQAPCLLVPPPSIEKVTPAIYSYGYELLWIERSASARAAASNLSQTMIRLRNALQADKTIGGTASGCWVRGIRPDDEIRDQQSNYWYGARIDFEVWTSS